jgi:hypothetical protein
MHPGYNPEFAQNDWNWKNKSAILSQHRELEKLNMLESQCSNQHFN